MTVQVPSQASNLDSLAAVDLNLLVPLMALLEERSVTRAAARVGLSQPDDEPHPGPAPQADGRRPASTPGQHHGAHPARRRADRTAAPGPRPDRPRGPLRWLRPATDERVVTVSLTASPAIVVGGHLARLVAERAPHATLRLLTSALPDETAFTEEGADVVLASRPLPSALRRERLYDDRHVVVAAEDAPPRGATAV